MSHRINPSITEMQKQIIMGTILGGSSLMRPTAGVNSYLSMRGRDEDWLEYKAMHLANLASDKPFTPDKIKRWHSICYPIFNDFRKEFYDENGKRRLKNNTLDGLKDIAFAIWYGDSGKYENGLITLRTHHWGEDNSKIIVRYLKASSFNSQIGLIGKHFRVVLDKKSSNKFFELAEPHLPHWFLVR